ncbi:MAG: hypothetical protein ACR2P0_15590 [Acidimicrobiales bacterium]
MVEPLDDDLPDDWDEVDPERLEVCAYWRCGELFERRTSNHEFCRKACRSRQRKWERAQVRKAARAAKSARRAL